MTPPQSRVAFLVAVAVVSVAAWFGGFLGFVASAVVCGLALDVLEYGWDGGVEDGGDEPPR